ncbi:unnamed protein product [Pocillopora meandrina]|uniref:Uncharacterized protein n=1 Tax=Pocillopora meandrina TaxID=46732 RepID=A0AAU9W219_9CNID|nr:unnamed protein product [Pocillopora meandrina]
MNNFDLNKVWVELQTSHPYLVEIMNAVSGKEKSAAETKRELQVKYSFLYSILMNELNLVKRLNSVLIIECECTKKLQERLNILGVCLSSGRRDTLLKLLWGHFSDKVVQKIKRGSVFRDTGDNWDLKILKGHMRKEIQNEDLHLFASNLIENQINFNP